MSEYEEMARAIVIKMQFQEKPLHFDQALKCAKEAVKLVLASIEGIENSSCGCMIGNPLGKFWIGVFEVLVGMENEK